MNCPEGTREATLGCAPAENDLILFADYRRQTLRGFFDRLSSHTRLLFFADTVLYALKDFLIKRLGSLLEHTTQNRRKERKLWKSCVSVAFALSPSMTAWTAPEGTMSLPLCAETDEAARNRMERILRSLAEQNGVAEQRKAENQMEWVRQMNACKAQAEEAVKAELIYD